MAPVSLVTRTSSHRPGTWVGGVQAPVLQWMGPTLPYPPYCRPWVFPVVQEARFN